MEKLNDVCVLITDGKHGDCQNEDGSGFYFISCKDVKDGWIDYSNARQITENDFRDTHRRTRLEANDIVITNSGTIGRMALIPNNPKTHRTTFQKSVAIIKPDKDKVMPIWLYYYLIDNKNALIAYAGGTAQKNLLLRDMRAFSIDVSPLNIQRTIAAILSAYDDLIENNLRRIKILEEMAQNLYREWFVNFRFPGHEKVRFVDSPLGKIPEGWSIVAFTEIADVLSGGTPKTTISEYWGGHISFFAPKDTPSYYYVTETEKTITELGLKKCNSQLYPPETVFITARGTVGNVVLTADDMAMNQSCYALRGKEKIGQKYLYMLMLNQVEYLKKNTGGATFSTIIVDTFQRMQIIKPPNIIIGEFESLINPLFKQMINMINRNANLRQTRDLLLPKLISGEVAVSELDIKVPGEAAS